VILFGKEGMGTITAGKIDIGERITFATVQTLSNIELLKVDNYWDIIIVDEAHHCVGTPDSITMFSKVMSYLCAEYRIGLTATPDRSDGLTRCMFAIMGGLFARIDKDDIEHELCPVHVSVLPYDLHLTADQILNDKTNTVDWAKTITAVTEDVHRNALITDLAMSMEGPTLVLSGRCAHLDKLCELCEHGVVLKAGKDKVRSDLMFATYQLMSEGFDYPELRNIILATPIGNDRIVTQSVGRLTRKCPTKTYATVCDIQDKHGVFKKFNENRLRIYKKMGYEICQ
jgi:superfamily II DNA or RNA helicase